MKKIFVLLLTVCMVFSFVACDTNEGTPQGSNEQGSTTDGGDVTNVSTDGEVNLVRGTKGDGTLTVVEMLNGYEVTLTHPEIIKENLANEIIEGIHIEFSFEDDSEQIILMIDEEFDPEVRHLELDANGSATHDKFYYADYYIEDESIIFITQEPPIDIANAQKVAAKIWSADDSKEYYKSFDLAEVFNPYTGDTTLVVGASIYKSGVAFDNVIGDVSLTVKEQYDSYHITITHQSYMKDFIDGQEIVFNVTFRNDSTTDPDEISLSYSSYDPGEINSNYNSKSAGSTFYDSKNVEYTIDENSLTWYLPKSYEFDPSEMYRYVVGIHSDGFNNYESLYSEYFVKSNCYIPYDDSIIIATNPEELTIFDGHWTRPDGYVTTSVQSIDSFMVDSESGTWAEYNEFAFYGDSLPCYANDSNLTMLLSLAGEITLTEQNGNLVDSQGNVQYVKSEPIDQNDILQEFLGEWLFSPDISSNTLIFTEDECQEFSSRGELLYTGSWELVETEIIHSDGSVVYNPVIRLDLGDYHLSGDYAIFDTKTLIHLSDTYSSNYIIHESQADENLKLMNMLKVATTPWRCEYEDDIGTHRASLDFEAGIDRRVTLLIESHLKANDTRPYVFTIEGTWDFVEDDVLRIIFNDGTYEDIPFDGTSLEIEHYDLRFGIAGLLHNE